MTIFIFSDFNFIQIAIDTFSFALKMISKTNKPSLVQGFFLGKPGENPCHVKKI